MRTLRASAALLCLVHALAHGVEPTISATFAHALVGKSDGTVSAWGSDQFGKLGTGRSPIRTSPGKVQGLPPILQVASTTFGSHFVARDANGRVWTWGQAEGSKLGPRVQRNASIPGRVQGLSNVIQVAATNRNSLALRADGTVWWWGSWLDRIHSVPEPIPGLVNIVQISAAERHIYARRSDGTVWAVGDNLHNEMGIGAPSLDPLQYATVPVQVLLPPNVVEVAAVIGGGAARTADGKVWSWGASDAFSTGDPLPREVTGFPQTAVKLTGESQKYMAILADGTLWSWGNASAPAQIAGFSGVRAAASPDGSYDFMVVDTLGRMFVRSNNWYGQSGTGNVAPANSGAIVQVPSPTNFVDVRFTYNAVMGVTSDGGVWTWGAEVNGSFGDGDIQTYSVPRPIAGITNIKQVATGRHVSAALDTDGHVWVWGDMTGLLNGTGVPSSVPVQIAISDVKTIALGWSQLLMLKTDGSVWLAGEFMYLSNPVPTQVAGLSSIKSIGAGSELFLAVGQDGRLWAWGFNAKGEVGVGDTTQRATPTEVTIPGGVALVSANNQSVLALTNSGEVYGWGDVSDRNMHGVPSSVNSIVTTPQKVQGIPPGVIDVTTGMFHFLARRADGTLISWGASWAAGALGRDVAPATPAHVPSPVLQIDNVIATAAANVNSFAIRADGTVWAWGTNFASGAGTPIGDGTFAYRDRPVLVIRENAAGNLETNDWFLDAKPGTPKTIPASKVPSVVSTATSLSSDDVLNIDGGVNVRVADQAKTLGLYVTGLVPVEFLAQASAAPGAQAKVAHLKAGTLVLVNLTPAGWTVASGQLTAFASGTGSAFLGASGLLTNVNPALIPGARFCIGYGESATDMLKTGTIRDFLSLDGASSSAFGGCLLSGVYVDGPATSPQGSAIPLRAVVVGQSPTGTVRFREKFTDISSNVAINPVNAAVSDASFNYTPAAVGEYAFGAAYGGNGLNAAMSSEVPLRHVVQPVLATTTTRIEGPVTSEIGMEATFVATVSGNRPGGTVQFKRGGVNEGSPVPVIDDRAVMSVVGLGIGTYSFTASYLGDAGNTPSTSNAFSHQVLDVATSGAALGSASNPAALGDTVTLTATVTGTNPTGTVTLRERATVINSKSLSGGAASFTLTGLTAGVHVYFVDYSGDGGNPAATSNAVFQQVTLNLPPGGDLDGDGIPNGVELSLGTDPSAKDNNVFGNSTLFAMQQYRDFLGREGDAGGIAAWSANLDSGVQTRAQVIESFFDSPEFQGTIAPVARLYFAYFLRVPDYAGLNFWIAYYRAGNSLDAISNAFAGSAEFTNTYGPLDSGQFVNLVYQNVLGRAPDAGGFAFWKAELDSARRSRGQVMLGFSESDEYRGNINNEIYVTMAYSGMLRRAPDAGGFSFWVQYMDSGYSGLALLNAFLGSAEYHNRFLP